MGKELLIGFDASSTKVGYTIMEVETLKPIEMSYFSIEEIEDMQEKVDIFEDVLNEINERYKNQQYEIQNFVIEEPTKFMRGKSNADAIIKTNICNFAFRRIARTLGMEVDTVTANSARKNAFPNVKIPKGSDQKEEYFHIARKEVEENYPDIFTFQKFTSPSGKDKGKTKYRPIMYDVVDSYIVSKGYIKRLRKT